jgi:hypothetical protein
VFHSLPFLRIGNLKELRTRSGRQHRMCDVAEDSVYFLFCFSFFPWVFYTSDPLPRMEHKFPFLDTVFSRSFVCISQLSVYSFSRPCRFQLLSPNNCSVLTCSMIIVSIAMIPTRLATSLFFGLSVASLLPHYSRDI